MDLTLSSPELSRSTSLISVNSAVPEEGDTRDKMAHLAAFFKFDKTHATCAKCGTKLKLQEKSVFNLKKHYKAKHVSFEGHFRAALAGGSKRGRSHSVQDIPDVKRRQSSIETPFKHRINQNEALDLYYRFFISDMLPTIFTVSEPFRQFLAYICPEFKVPARTKLMRDIQHMGEKAKVTLSNILAKQDYVATTADIWSSNHRSFLGMTVTWLDKETLERSNAVLGVKELKEARTGEFLADAIAELHQEFGISRKVVTTTTDNGDNYVSAFNQFGMAEDDKDRVEEDHELVKSRPILVGEALEGTIYDILLPKHRRCGAHTVNLLASSDTEKVPGWTSNPRPAFSKPAAKAQAIWNAQNRKTAMANDIKAALGRRLVTPGVTRWNSSYDAYKCLSTEVSDQDKLNKLNQICQRQQPHALPLILEEDKEVWSEYVKVTAPLAVCLEKLQAEEKAYMGCLLPQLRLLKDSLLCLSRDDTIRHAKNLVTHLLDQKTNDRQGPRGFENRFGHLFKDMDLLMATAVHPHFKLPVVTYLCQQDSDTIDDVKRLLIKELMNRVKEPKMVPDFHETVQMDRDETDYMWQFTEGQVQTGLAEKINEELERWCKIKVAAKDKVSPHLFPHEFREAWVDLFLKYNTPLPSSASVERLFSFGSDILRPKRSALRSSPNFERLVFLKGNLKILKNKLQVEEEEIDMV